MIADNDDVLTDPVRGLTWSFGMDDDPVEPSFVLLPGRVDGPASSGDGCSAVGQFASQAAAATAADALAGICVAETVILPGQPYPRDDELHLDTVPAVIDRLTSHGRPRCLHHRRRHRRHALHRHPSALCGSRSCTGHWSPDGSDLTTVP